MTIAWMLYVLLVGTLLAIGAYSLDSLLRRAKQPTRWVWVAALLGIIALAMLSPRRERAAASLRLPDSASTAANAEHGAATVASLASLLMRPRDAILSSVSAAMMAVERDVPTSLLPPFVVAWLALSASLLSIVVIVNRRVDRARDGWPLAEVQGVKVRIAPEGGPAVIGLAKPEIVVPHWLLERNPDEQRLVVMHESEHIAANDQLLPIGAWIVAALLPWHPAVWWSLSRLRLAVELDCDARVLARGVKPRSYGALLIDIAGRCEAHRVGALALADRTSHLEQRLLAMKTIQSRYTIARAGVLGAIATLAIVAACEARLPTSADIESMDVATASRMLAADGKRARIYVVDGVTMTEDKAHALTDGTAETIASVRLRRTAAANEIYITTKKSAALGARGLGEPNRMSFKSKESGDTGSVRIVGDGPTLTTAHESAPFGGLLFVDGALTSTKAFHELSPRDIESVEVIKGAAALKLYSDPAAANGVIKVTMKRH